MKKLTKLKILGQILAVLILGFFYATFAIASQPITEIDLDGDSRWDVTYSGRTYDAVNDQTTFSYNVTVSGDPALSHLTLGFPLCDDGLSVVGYTPESDVSIGLDPTTGVEGIKWDIGLDSATHTREYSYTISGNIPEGNIEVAVKAGTFAALGVRLGPDCGDVFPPPSDTYSISGTVFIDANQDSSNNGEPGIKDVSIALFDGDGNLVAITISDESGNYTFTDVLSGDYHVFVLPANEFEDFNEMLFIYFDATSPMDIPVSILAENSTGNDFGFAPDTFEIIDDFNPDDPNSDGFTFVGTGKTIGFWKHQNAVAIKGKGRAQVDSSTLQGYIDAIEELFLINPFQFNDSNENQDAFDILAMRTSDANDLLKKQLLGTEFNEVAGLGLSGDYAALQTVMISWGEYLVANSTNFTRDQLITAKDIFDLINNTGE